MIVWLLVTCLWHTWLVSSWLSSVKVSFLVSVVSMLLHFSELDSLSFHWSAWSLTPCRIIYLCQVWLLVTWVFICFLYACYWMLTALLTWFRYRHLHPFVLVEGWVIFLVSAVTGELLVFHIFLLLTSHSVASPPLICGLGFWFHLDIVTHTKGSFQKHCF